jgi:PAS domain S-box-containing protein
MRVRQITPVALVLGATIAASLGARLLGEQAARRDSDRRAEIAAAQIRDRVEEGSSLTGSLGQFVSTTDVTNQAFEINALQWLSPAGLPAAGWVERVPASGRAAYERQTGEPIVMLDRLLGIVPVGRRSSYLPATLISGIPPMNVPGLDLGSDPGFAAALARASRSDSEAATPLATLPDGEDGLFLIRPSLRLTAGPVQTGFAVLFESAPWLRAAATNTPTLGLTTGYDPGQELGGAAAVTRTFWEAGQQFDVVVPQESVSGTAAALPWIILATGLVLAALAGALAANARRRARAQDELDRIFSLSPDLITVANFAGRFTRVNPAAERTLGYAQEELLAHPYLDFVHPDDREQTATEAAAIAQGKTRLSFENRYVCKDGSHRVLEWTSTPVVQDRVMYAVARDVTERRQAETELVRLTREQAALRRVATLVARGALPSAVLDAVAAEMQQVLDADAVTIGRYEACDEMTVVAHRSAEPSLLTIGTRVNHEGNNVTATVRRTEQPARLEDLGQAQGGFAELFRSLGMHAVVGTPIVVDGRLWGTILGSWNREEPPPADTEERMAKFAELLDTAIANADSRDQLTASRARLVTEADEARRRVVRDLHDGAQQRLVHTIVTLKLAQGALKANDEEAESLIAEGLEQAEQGNAELRELAHGILPAVLAQGGLRAGVNTIVSRVDLPVDVDIPAERFLVEIEASAYFVVAEALTNVMKHSHAGRAEVRASVVDGMLQVEVRDDGVGGADPTGHGLVGLGDRLTALGGQLNVETPASGGTLLVSRLPLSAS